MTTTYTTTTTYTRTHTAVHLTDVVMGTIAEILAHLKIDLSSWTGGWNTTQKAIQAWIEEGSLAVVVLECHQPSGRVAPVIELPVRYGVSGLGDARFTADRAALARYRVKFDAVPAGTTHKIVCTFNGSHTSMPGWSTTSLASTADLKALSFGTLASAPDASLELRYLR